mgnify:CR=1 FL=1
MDSMFKVLDISASGLTAERVRMDIIANNIANANTTLSVNGEPYKRKSVVLASTTDTSFSMDLQENIKNMGVEVIKNADDTALPKLKYDPSGFPMNRLYNPSQPGNHMIAVNPQLMFPGAPPKMDGKMAGYDQTDFPFRQSLILADDGVSDQAILGGQVVFARGKNKMVLELDFP